MGGARSRLDAELVLYYGCQGEPVRVLHDVLRRMGYLPRRDTPDSVEFLTPICAFSPAAENTFDLVTMNALQAFQRNNGLPLTGALDKRTLQLLDTPRCGNPDSGVTPMDTPLPQFVPYPSGPWTWLPNQKHILSYAIDNYNGLKQQYVNDIIADAYGQWATASEDLKIEPLVGAIPNIRITFEPLPSDVLGSGGKPNDQPITTLKFNQDIFKDENNKKQFLNTALHEGGHTLGLAHTVIPENVMIPVAKDRTTLGDNDKLGIKYLYSGKTLPGINICNFTDRAVSWFCFNSEDPFKIVALWAGDLGREEINVYNPPDNGSGKYFLRFTLVGGGTELAGGIAPKNSKIGLMQKGSSLYAHVS